jgi:hypothetical protein
MRYDVVITTDVGDDDNDYKYLSRWGMMLLDVPDVGDDDDNDYKYLSRWGTMLL